LTQFQGEVDQAINQYLATDDLETGVIDLVPEKNRFGTGELRLIKFWVENAEGKIVPAVVSGERCFLAVEYISVDGRERRDVAMSVHINTAMGSPISLVNTYMLNEDFAAAPAHGVIRLELHRLPLTAGRYTVDLNLATHAGQAYSDFIRNAAAFDVLEGDYYGTGRPGNSGAPVILQGHWHITSELADL
jgi:hypothetical protein